MTGGKKCDILLVPPVINPFFSDNNRNFMPLGLLALAASLREKSLNPLIFRPRRKLVTASDYQLVAASMLAKRPKMVGFSTWCISYPASILIARELKSLEPDLPVIFGGPQASILVNQTMAVFKQVDYILAGEADETLPRLVLALLNGSNDKLLSEIPGLHFRKKEGHNSGLSSYGIIHNLDALPVPAYDLITRTRSIKLDVGRGCPFHCTYCSTKGFFSGKYRTKSSGRIIAEMNLAYDSYHISKFSFAHDMFTFNHPFILKLCRDLSHQYAVTGKKFKWTCSARVDCVTEELLSSMHSAGCCSIFFGIETGSVTIQEVIRKRLNLQRAYEVADICRKCGIDMHASFIIGFPEETESDIEKTLRCIIELTARGAIPQISELSVLPGTQIFEIHKSELKFDGRFSNFSESFCGNEERAIISAYPEIFSSFWYLPVNAIDRATSFLLSSSINSLHYFRNTLYLLAGEIAGDLEKVNLTALFREYSSDFLQHVKSGLPPPTYLVSQLEAYLESKKDSFPNPFIYEVFAFEATRSILVSRFIRWQWVKSRYSVTLSPIWDILKTAHPLKKILPSLNGWKKSTPKGRKKIHLYLLTATSEKECKYIQITEEENIILNNLKQYSDNELAAEWEKISANNETETFARKLIRRGVIYLPD